MRKLYIFGLIALAGLIIGLAWAEQITLTTYYPAPYGAYNVLKTNYLQAGIDDTNCDYTRFSKATGDPVAAGNYVAGFMWNQNDAAYGDGDDFTICTYEDRDVVLQPSGTGRVRVGTSNSSRDLEVYGDSYVHQELGGCIIMSYGENSWNTTCPPGFHLDTSISPPISSDGGIFYCCRD